VHNRLPAVRRYESMARTRSNRAHDRRRSELAGWRLPIASHRRGATGLFVGLVAPVRSTRMSPSPSSMTRRFARQITPAVLPGRMTDVHHAMGLPTATPPPRCVFASAATCFFSRTALRNLSAQPLASDATCALTRR